MKKIAVVFGTRPEIIKLAPVIFELKKFSRTLKTVIISTGQHDELTRQMLDTFKIKPDIQFKIMQKNQNDTYIFQSVFGLLNTLFKKNKPDCLVVQGDTTTAVAAALAAKYNQIKIAHVEAGLRTYDFDNPFPEELNRKIIDDISDLLFAPSNYAKKNLMSEGNDIRKIEVVGNTVIDALKMFDIKKMANDKKIILVTTHRKEIFGKPLLEVFKALKFIAQKYSNYIKIIYPVHPNPQIFNHAYSKLAKVRSIELIKPMEYPKFINLVANAFLVLTDSGGIQEEASYLGKPVLILRHKTERPEIIDFKNAKIVEMSFESIVNDIEKLILDKKVYQSMSKPSKPYGDGHASMKIVKRLLKELRK